MIQKLKRIVLAAVTTVIGVLGTTSVALTGMGGQRRGRWGDIRQTMQPGWDQSGASSGNLRQPGDRQNLRLCSGAGPLVASRAQLPRKINASRPQHYQRIEREGALAARQRDEWIDIEALEPIAEIEGEMAEPDQRRHDRVAIERNAAPIAL